MNQKLKKGIFWGGIIASMILVMNVFHYLFGGIHTLAFDPHGHGHGHGGMGPSGGWGHSNHMIGNQSHFGFLWIGFLLFLIFVLVAVVLVMKWIRRKSKASSMQQFIDTSLMGTYSPLSSQNQNANVLDQWEKSLNNKKENE